MNGDGVINNLDKNLDAAQNGKTTYRSWIHHTQLGTTNWTMVEDVAGMVPREDNKIELNRIEIPGWNYFTVNNLRYHEYRMSPSYGTRTAATTVVLLATACTWAASSPSPPTSWRTSSMTRLRERSRSRTIPVPRLPSAPKPSRT